MAKAKTKENAKMTGAQFRTIRNKLGLSQQAYGEKLGFSEKGSQRSVCALENGEREVRGVVANAARSLLAAHTGA